MSGASATPALTPSSWAKRSCASRRPIARPGSASLRECPDEPGPPRDEPPGLRPLPVAEAGVAVKICGLTRPGDAALAASLGAAALGVVLAPSPRRVTIARAAEVLAAAPPGVARVGVFVEPELDSGGRGGGDVWAGLGAVVGGGGGGEGRGDQGGGGGRGNGGLGRGRGLGHGWGLGRGWGLRHGRGHGWGGVILRVVHVGSGVDLGALVDFPADAFLLDAPPIGGRMGGTGRRFDWAAAAELPWEPVAGRRWRAA
jgi:hypothetical protein